MSGPTSSTPLLSPRLSGSFGGPKLLWRAGALLAAVGVLTGAFGAHGLRNRPGITPQKIHAWETAAHYAIFNGIALLVISQHPRFGVHKFAGPAVGIGAVLFSGSIFLLTFTRERMRWLGPVTPLGGSILIAGYLALAL